MVCTRCKGRKMRMLYKEYYTYTLPCTLPLASAPPAPTLISGTRKTYSYQFQHHVICKMSQFLSVLFLQTKNPRCGKCKSHNYQQVSNIQLNIWQVLYYKLAALINKFSHWFVACFQCLLKSVIFIVEVIRVILNIDPTIYLRGHP